MNKIKGSHDMKLLLIILTVSFWFILGFSPLYAATYYVRTDGGTDNQCNGTADVSYPGTGTNQSCAWSHPFWALDSSGNWKIQGGDTLLISSGSYQMGFGAPNTGWCSTDYPWGCCLPPLPSGSSIQNPTRILGAGWDTGCSNPPELWGTQRADNILNLDGTSRAVIDCLEITDHSGCVEFHANSSVACKRDVYPYGDWALRGIYARDSSNVTLRNLNIHGFAESGMLTGRLTDWTVEKVRIAGNGSAGWNGDLGGSENSSNSGTLQFKKWTVEWNGCAETYPGKQPDHCWAQHAGGYGDGVGFARSGGHWIIEDSIIRYNTSDGLDLLYVGVGYPNTMIEIQRTQAYGNAGNQIKVSGSASIINTLAIGNCAYFYQKPFAQEMGDLSSEDQCRAGGASISINVGQGDSANVINSTIVGHGWALLEANCITNDFPDQPPCNGSESVTIKNNIFRGDQVATLTYQNLSDFVGDGDPSHFTTGKVDYNVIYNAEISSSTGSNDIVQDPLFVNSNLDNFDGHLQVGSPAINSGLQVGSLNGLVPANDLTGASRPYGSGVDRGAYEYGATTPSTETISTPTTPNGSTSGNPGTSYSYTTGGSTSSLGHLVEFQFDWNGDGSSDLSSWGSSTQSKTWTTNGIYSVRARARCTQDTSIVSSWSGTLSVTITGTASIFSDVPTSHWAYNYILAIYNAHITTGCSQNPLKYCPEDNVTREQMAAFLVRAKEGEPAANYCDTGLPFTDVTSTMWSCKYIKRLKELGITTGYGDGRYGPLDTVTREQMAAFIIRAVEGEPAANYCSTGSPFTDVDSNSWACKYIKRLKERGITTGYGDGRYGPSDMVTRAQMAAFLARAFLGMQ